MGCGSTWKTGKTIGAPRTVPSGVGSRLAKCFEVDAPEHRRRLGFVGAPDLATLLAGWEPLDEILPDVDEGLLPLDDIRL